MYIGSMTRFISPETASNVCARHATSRPTPMKLIEPSTTTASSASRLPLTSTPNTSHAKPNNTTISGSAKMSRLSMMLSRKSLLRIGVAIRRLSSLRTRRSTVAKPTPHRPPPIRFMPIKPGIRNVM